MKLNKRGHLVVGFIAGAITSLALTFFMTHHVVVDNDKCRWSDEANAIMCDFHYEGNN
jgi:hypothetical protein